MTSIEIPGYDSWKQRSPDDEWYRNHRITRPEHDLSDFFENEEEPKEIPDDLNVTMR